MWLTAADGTKLHAWLLVPRGWSREMKRTRPLVMFFQVLRWPVLVVCAFEPPCLQQCGPLVMFFQVNQGPALDTLPLYCFVTARVQFAAGCRSRVGTGQRPRPS